MDCNSLGKLCGSDFVKGFILTVIVAAITVIQNSVAAGALHVDWNIFATTTITAACAYLLKNLATGSGGSFLTNSGGPPTVVKPPEKNSQPGNPPAPAKP